MINSNSRHLLEALPYSKSSYMQWLISVHVSMARKLVFSGSDGMSLNLSFYLLCNYEQLAVIKLLA